MPIRRPAMAVQHAERVFPYARPARAPGPIRLTKPVAARTFRASLDDRTVICPSADVHLQRISWRRVELIKQTLVDVEHTETQKLPS